MDKEAAKSEPLHRVLKGRRVVNRWGIERESGGGESEFEEEQRSEEELCILHSENREG